LPHPGCTVARSSTSTLSLRTSPGSMLRSLTRVPTLTVTGSLSSALSLETSESARSS